jgi:S-DNA-T family DNA segregation ATPase FtsK/SpoIIIE
MSEKDVRYDKAVGIVLDAGRASTMLLQRRLDVGYARASRLIESMIEGGILGGFNGSCWPVIKLPECDVPGQEAAR